MNKIKYDFLDEEWIECDLYNDGTLHTVHKLKIIPEYYDAVRTGIKIFEVRKNDRNFKVGDILILKEWDATRKDFTGRTARRIISYIFDNQFYLKEGYVILSFDMLNV